MRSSAEPGHRLAEHEFLRRLAARLSTRRADVLLGPGDDSAIVAGTSAPLALTTDTLVEGVHHRAEWLSPAEIGQRAVMVNLSDLAAMGATPAHLLLALVVPDAWSTAMLDELVDGFAAVAAEQGAALVGGNLTRGQHLAVTVTAIGSLGGPALRRNGARVDDLVVVSGALGGAAAAVSDWLAGRAPHPELRACFAAPRARVALGRALAAAGAHAAIDVSDGFLADLDHVCRASRVAAVIERERLPRLPEVARRDASGGEFAATGGEDYELVAAIPPHLECDLPEIARATATPLTVVGRFVASDGAPPGATLVGADGKNLAIAGRGGFDHFATVPAG